MFASGGDVVENADAPNKLSKSLNEVMVAMPKLLSRYAENKSAVAVEGVVAAAIEEAYRFAVDDGDALD